ncbi:hypothetical protein HAX54_014248, partial [Datura stramonium]|nr:hypothetical protein [Datura stramonium]
VKVLLQEVRGSGQSSQCSMVAKYVPSQQPVSDDFAKPLTKAQFGFFNKKLRVVPLSISSLIVDDRDKLQLSHLPSDNTF